MRTTVFCTPTAKGIHAFYLTYEGETYFLFQQNFRRGVHEFYSEGVSLNVALKYALAHGDSAILRTMKKLPMYIKYTEKENGIAVLEQTLKKQIYRDVRKEKNATRLLSGHPCGAPFHLKEVTK